MWRVWSSFFLGTSAVVHAGSLIPSDFTSPHACQVRLMAPLAPVAEPLPTQAEFHWVYAHGSLPEITALTQKAVFALTDPVSPQPALMAPLIDAMRSQNLSAELLFKTLAELPEARWAGLKPEAKMLLIQATGIQAQRAVFNLVKDQPHPSHELLHLLIEISAHLQRWPEEIVALLRANSLLKHLDIQGLYRALQNPRDSHFLISEIFENLVTGQAGRRAIAFQASELARKLLLHYGVKAYIQLWDKLNEGASLRTLGKWHCEFLGEFGGVAFFRGTNPGAVQGSTGMPILAIDSTGQLWRASDNRVGETLSLEGLPDRRLLPALAWDQVFWREAESVPFLNLPDEDALRKKIKIKN